MISPNADRKLDRSSEAVDDVWEDVVSLVTIPVRNLEICVSEAEFEALRELGEGQGLEPEEIIAALVKRFVRDLRE